MSETVPPLMSNAFRITLSLDFPESRMDNTLLNALKEQNENLTLKNISRGALKKLFNDKKIFIKGQRAKPNSALAKGITYVDIVGF
jgi:hypothetical protein